ncbi:hypothetical protein J8273_1644 [Carpediemonas membranifera]|uniref:Uncharacterized protein n=1 Tax=Carpediemonas membranifera TaxID=201153 RepID=A0A8J6BFW0_9EUKA|nr:hypothetical protein J8273_1644 [Carpediemonas membranifera]|eukprot:KAG9396627.1 hypothetical protein J8273_1644 [Carpediemonas membranifera]
MFKVKPAELLWHNYQYIQTDGPPLEWRGTFTVTNTGRSCSRFRLIPPQTAEFMLMKPNGEVEETAVVLAPGLSHVVHVVFTPLSNSYRTDSVIIQTPEGSIELPLKARRDPPCLAGLPRDLNLGPVLPYERLSGSYHITNTGSNGTVSMTPVDEGENREGHLLVGPFDLSPDGFNIASGDSIDIDVAVDTSVCGDFTCEYHMCDAGAPPERHTLSAQVKPIRTALVSLDKKPLAVPVTLEARGPGVTDVTRDDAEEEAAELIVDLRETIIGGCRDVAVGIRNNTDLPVPIATAWDAPSAILEALLPSMLSPHSTTEITIRFQPEKIIAFERTLSVYVGLACCCHKLADLRVVATSQRPDLVVSPSLLMLPGDFLVRKSAQEWVTVKNQSNTPLYMVWAPEFISPNNHTQIDTFDVIKFETIHVEVVPREVILPPGQTLQFRVSIKGVSSGRASVTVSLHAVPTESDSMTSRRSRPNDPLYRFRSAILDGRGSVHPLNVKCSVAGPEVSVTGGGLEFGPVMIHRDLYPQTSLTLTNGSDTYAPFVLTDFCCHLPPAQTGGTATRLDLRPPADPEYPSEDEDASAYDREPEDPEDRSIFRFMPDRGCLDPLEKSTVAVELDVPRLLETIRGETVEFPHTVTGFIGLHVQHQAMPILVQCRATLCRPVVGLDPVRLSFPGTFVDQTATEPVTVYNLALTDAEIVFPVATNELFDLSFSPSTATVPAGAQLTVTASMTPRKVTSFNLVAECKVAGVDEPYALHITCVSRGCSLELSNNDQKMVLTAAAVEIQSEAIPVRIGGALPQPEHAMPVQRSHMDTAAETGEPGQANRLLARKRERMGLGMLTHQATASAEINFMPDDLQTERVFVEGGLELEVSRNLASQRPFTINIAVRNLGGVPTMARLTSLNFSPTQRKSKQASPPPGETTLGLNKTSRRLTLDDTFQGRSAFRSKLGQTFAAQRQADVSVENDSKVYLADDWGLAVVCPEETYIAGHAELTIPVEVYANCYGTYRDTIRVEADVFNESFDIPLVVHVSGCPVRLSSSHAVETVRSVAKIDQAGSKGISWPAQSVGSSAPAKRVRIQNTTPFWQMLELRCIDVPAPDSPARVTMSDSGEVKILLPTDGDSPNSTSFTAVTRFLRIPPRGVETAIVEYCPRQTGPVRAMLVSTPIITHKRDSFKLDEGVHPFAEANGCETFALPLDSSGVEPRLEWGDGKIRIKHRISSGPETEVGPSRTRQTTLTNRTDAPFAFTLRAQPECYSLTLLDKNGAKTRISGQSPLIELKPQHKLTAAVTYSSPLLMEKPGIFFSPPDAVLSGELVAKFSNGHEQTLLLSTVIKFPALSPEITTVEFPETTVGSQRSMTVTLTNETIVDARYTISFIDPRDRERAKRNVRSALGRQRTRTRHTDSLEQLEPIPVLSDTRTGRSTAARRSARSARGYTRLMSPHPRDLSGSSVYYFNPASGVIKGHKGGLVRSQAVTIIFRPTDAVRFRASYFVEVAFGRGCWIEIVGEGSRDEVHLGDPVVD